MSLQALIIGKSLPYLDHYRQVEIKEFALEIIIFEIPPGNTSNTSLGNLGFKIIQGRLLIEDLRYAEL